MEHMHAAVIDSFDEVPHYRLVPSPVPGPGREVAEVLAVGIHPVTRGIATGRHYASSDALPLVPGIDAVVRRNNGSLAYVGGPGSATMAERVAFDPRSAIAVPADADPAIVAATMNPAMSSWIALRARLEFTPGQSVLVLGATGNAGAMAVQVARQLGAGRVIACGRNRVRLDGLLAEGADEVVRLTGDDTETAAALAASAARVDVVLDYLWGAPSELAMRAVLRARSDRTQALDWVHLGSVAGPTITLDGAGLRSTALRISGSGVGSVDLDRADLAGLAAAVSAGVLMVQPRCVPLAEIETAWLHEDAPGERTVVIP